MEEAYVHFCSNAFIPELPLVGLVFYPKKFSDIARLVKQVSIDNYSMEDYTSCYHEKYLVLRHTRTTSSKWNTARDIVLSYTWIKDLIPECECYLLYADICITDDGKVHPTEIVDGQLKCKEEFYELPESIRTLPQTIKEHNQLAFQPLKDLVVVKLPYAHSSHGYPEPKQEELNEDE